MGTNDELPYLITCGKVTVKTRAIEFTEHNVKFDDGSQIDNVDIVIYATGFRPDFSFVECDDLQGNVCWTASL